MKKYSVKHPQRHFTIDFCLSTGYNSYERKTTERGERMPLKIIRNDITKIQCDAVVNAANRWLAGGGGVDGAIHRAAGPELDRECSKLGGCEVGQAKVTKGCNMLCKYIIHTVGPVWQNGRSGESELLASCYRESLRLAVKYKCESVAFPLISTGAYGYPKEEALQIAVSEITDFLLRNEMTVYLVVYDKLGFQASKKLISDVEEYIDEHYIETHFLPRNSSVVLDAAPQRMHGMHFRSVAGQAPEEKALCQSAPCGEPSLDEMLSTLDESFSQMLLRKIDERGMSDAQCYKKANIDRKLFSKIRSNVNYKPSKATVLAFAIALELSLDETRDMLMKAGFALSHSNKFDVIVEYFIKNKKYDIFEINEVLFSFDQVMLGA